MADYQIVDYGAACTKGVHAHVHVGEFIRPIVGGVPTIDPESVVIVRLCDGLGRLIETDLCVKVRFPLKEWIKRHA